MSYCPWCQADVQVHVVGLTSAQAEREGYAIARSFSAHVQRCPDAPDEVKAAYRSPYP